MVYRGGRGGWQEGGGGKGGGHHEANGRGGGGQGRSRRNQGPRQPGRRPREKSMAWVPPNSARWAPKLMSCYQSQELCLYGLPLAGDMI